MGDAEADPLGHSFTRCNGELRRCRSGSGTLPQPLTLTLALTLTLTLILALALALAPTLTLTLGGRSRSGSGAATSKSAAVSRRMALARYHPSSRRRGIASCWRRSYGGCCTATRRRPLRHRRRLA